MITYIIKMEDNKISYLKIDDNKIIVENNISYLKIDDNKIIVENNISYLKANDNKIINENHIRWVKKISDCLEVCTKSIGCSGNGDTHKICKFYNIDSYNKLNKHFEENKNV